MLYILSMEYTSIGKNDLKISKFALGTWPFAGGELWGDQDDNDSIEAVMECYENGINFFDTAPGYGDGRSEEVLGKAIKNISEGRVFLNGKKTIVFKGDKIL